MNGFWETQLTREVPLRSLAALRRRDSLNFNGRLRYLLVLRRSGEYRGCRRDTTCFTTSETVDKLRKVVCPKGSPRPQEVTMRQTTSTDRGAEARRKCCCSAEKLRIVLSAWLTLSTCFPLLAMAADPFGAATEPASNYDFVSRPESAALIPNVASETGPIPAAAMFPATPVGPGQGPSFDDIGPLPGEVASPATRFPFWHSRGFSAAWLAKGGRDGFGVTDVELGTSVAPIYFDDLPALLITPGFGFHFWNAPNDLDLPARVYDAFIDVNWRSPITERFGLSFGVTPGAYGDFERFDSNSFQVTGWGMGDFALTPRWTLVGGVAVVRQLESRILPVGGLIWTPDDATRVELLVPRMRVARRLRSGRRDDLWVYVAGQFGGGSWGITLADGSTTLLTYNDLRVVVGAEWLTTDRLSGVAEIGYVFARDISAFGASQFTPTDTLLLRLGVTF